MAKCYRDPTVLLEEAIRGYDYPAKYFDFDQDEDAEDDRGIAGIEQLFQLQLRSDDWINVKQGLANVIHWAFANFPGRQTEKRTYFLRRVSRPKIDAFMRLVVDGRTPDLQQVFALELPIFTAMATTSKVLMFLDPDTHATFDSKIAQIQYQPTDPNRSVVRLSFGQLEDTAENMEAYVDWCNWCLEVNARWFEDAFRAADIERGMFKLVSDGDLDLAREIYRSALERE